MAVGEKNPVPSAARPRIEDKPSPKIEAVRRGEQPDLSVSGIAHPRRAGIARTHVGVDLQAIDRALKIPGNVQVHAIV